MAANDERAGLVGARAPSPEADNAMLDRLAEIQSKRNELEKYVMTLCHELRTPLNGTLGLLQVLQAKYASLPSDTIMSEAPDAMEAMIRECARTGDPEPMLGLFRAVFCNTGGPRATADAVDKLMAMAELQLAIVEVRRRAVPRGNPHQRTAAFSARRTCSITRARKPARARRPRPSPFSSRMRSSRR